MDDALRAAVERAKKAAGSARALADGIGISEQAISQWDKIPLKRVLDVERATGIPRDDLRPDLFKAPSQAVAS